MRTPIMLIAFAINLFVDEFLRHMWGIKSGFYNNLIEEGSKVSTTEVIVLVFWVLLVIGMIVLDVYSAIRKY